MQKLRQFEFLTLAIKISFLFDFCTDVLLIPLSRPLRVPQPKIAHKTFFFNHKHNSWSYVHRQVMYTNRAANLIWDHVTENDLLLRPRSHMRSHLKSPVCSKCKLCFSESVIKTDTVSLEELHQRILRENQWFVRSFQLSRLRHHNI